MYLTNDDPEKERRRMEFIVRGEVNRRVAVDMLRENLPLSMIQRITTLDEDTIRSLAHSIGITPK